MPKAPLFNMKGESLGTVDLPDEIFGVEPHADVLHEAVVMQLASRRLGTAKVKGRSEVSGGGKKPYRQKGTGRARQGSIRAAQWVGGGKIFGPTPRSYSYRLNKKVRRLALLSALSSRALEANFAIVDTLTMDKPSTKAMISVLENLKFGNTLVVMSEKDRNVELSARNLPEAMVLTVEGLNVYDILNHEKLLFTASAVEKAKEVFA
ncbi:MAG TPA: 50S ribosomal protein L4 [Bacillota bacterium]|nr:50S ribosomal protein L4 [Bacillota bacterium]HOH11008.1 50S ribosomal protein L4 [Bacillota bacterium]HOY89680.1 50S ribosomal protein L4 [Bacillota bacterium]HPI01731.1 50S ribosomal protein L4 [Bacillota bacterium]HPM64176.1 50S ribosomal protein L4 [Bacillota bacterium]